MASYLIKVLLSPTLKPFDRFAHSSQDSSISLSCRAQGLRGWTAHLRPSAPYSMSFSSAFSPSNLPFSRPLSLTLSSLISHVRSSGHDQHPTKRSEGTPSPRSPAIASFPLRKRDKHPFIDPFITLTFSSAKSLN